MKLAKLYNFLGNICYYIQKVNDIFDRYWDKLGPFWQMHTYFVLFTSAYLSVVLDIPVLWVILVSLFYFNRIAHLFDFWDYGFNKLWNMSHDRKEAIKHA